MWRFLQLLSVFAALMARAQVVINEIHYDPADPTRQEEFVELHNVGPTPVEDVLYLKLHHDPKGWAKDKPLTFDGETLADVAARHLDRLLEHLDALRSGREAYVSRRAPDYIKYASPYDQLARVKEWSAAAGGDEGEA